MGGGQWVVLPVFQRALNDPVAGWAGWGLFNHRRRRRRRLNLRCACARARVLQVRLYAPYLQAEVTVSGGTMKDALSTGFREIAGFIFGKNVAPGVAESKAVAMTSPVTLQMGGGGDGGSSSSTKTTIAMTSPVAAEMLPGGWLGMGARAGRGGDSVASHPALRHRRPSASPSSHSDRRRRPVARRLHHAVAVHSVHAAAPRWAAGAGERSRWRVEATLCSLHFPPLHVPRNTPAVHSDPPPPSSPRYAVSPNVVIKEMPGRALVALTWHGNSPREAEVEARRAELEALMAASGLHPLDPSTLHVWQYDPPFQVRKRSERETRWVGEACWIECPAAPALCRSAPCQGGSTEVEPNRPACPSCSLKPPPPLPLCRGSKMSCSLACCARTRCCWRWRRRRRRARPPAERWCGWHVETSCTYRCTYYCVDSSATGREVIGQYKASQRVGSVKMLQGRWPCTPARRPPKR